jgi:hypothetical protein
LCAGRVLPVIISLQQAAPKISECKTTGFPTGFKLARFLLVKCQRSRGNLKQRQLNGANATPSSMWFNVFSRQDYRRRRLRFRELAAEYAGPGPGQALTASGIRQKLARIPAAALGRRD